jgi:hypothetical protein
VTIQWLENGVAIPGANLTTYTIPVTRLSQNGKKYSVQLNGWTSPEATLTVEADSTAPTLVSSTASGFPQGIILNLELAFRRLNLIF